MKWAWRSLLKNHYFSTEICLVAIHTNILIESAREEKIVV